MGNKKGLLMDQTEFSQIRRSLGKTQEQLARLLGTSLKAIQSFEQGWRNIPVHIERQVLFLLAMKRPFKGKSTPCWVIQECPAKIRRNCPAWEFHGRQLCWFIIGTICQSEVQENWHDKMKICPQCEVFQPILLLS
jgi:DNA-binding XRE family transcriptional regulator